MDNPRVDYSRNYINNIKLLIESKGFSASFDSPTNFPIWNNSSYSLESFNGVCANKSLIYYKNNRDKFINSLLQEGSFFPFWISADGYILEGRHRAYVLQKHNKRNKRFLFLKCPWTTEMVFSAESKAEYLSKFQFDGILQTTQNLVVPCDNLFMAHRVTEQTARQLIADRICAINKIRPGTIKPHPFINDENVFNEFMTTLKN